VVGMEMGDEDVPDQAEFHPLPEKARHYVGRHFDEESPVEYERIVGEAVADAAAVAEDGQSHFFLPGYPAGFAVRLIARYLRILVRKPCNARKLYNDVGKLMQT